MRSQSFLAVLLTFALVGVLALGIQNNPASQAGRVQAASVVPEFLNVTGNITCKMVQGPGQTWIELKVDPNANGVYTDGTLILTISNTQNDKTFDWSSNIGLDAVIVKAGAEGSYVYRYDPPAEVTSDTNLTSPGAANQNSISHLAFCYDINDPTNTPTNTPVPPSATPTDTPTNTPVPPSATPTDTPTNTPVPPSATPTDTPTNTPVPPSATPTDTPVDPTVTPIDPTVTPVDPTATPVPPTNTPVPPTDTPVPPTNTPVGPTNTPVPPTNTPEGPTSTPSDPTTTPPPGATNTPPPAPTNPPVVLPTDPPSVPTVTPAPACNDLSLPTLSISWAPAQALPGTEAAFTVRVTNPHAFNVDQVSVSTSLAAMAQFVSATSTQGQPVFQAGNNSVVLDLGTLTAGQSVDVTVRVLLAANAPASSQVGVSSSVSVAGQTCLQAAGAVTITPAGIPVTGGGPGWEEIRVMLLAGLTLIVGAVWAGRQLLGRRLAGR
jgi:hypothetical protein